MSTMNVTSRISVSSAPTEVVTLGGTAQSLALGPYPASQSYLFGAGTSTTGTVAGVIDQHWESGPVVLAASATVTYTLSGMPADSFGRVAVFARMRKLVLQVTARTGNDALVVGNAGTHPWAAPWGAGTHTASARDLLVLLDNSPAGLPVVSGSSDQLLVTNSGSASMTFQLYLEGCTT